MTKLLFAQCEADSTEGTTTVSPGSKVGIQCTINGVDGDDSAVADKNLSASCFDVDSADTRTGVVYVWLRNVCTFQTQPGVGAEFSVIVYDKIAEFKVLVRRGQI